MQRDDSVYLKHIRDAAQKIESYTKKISTSAFKKDTLIQDAVIRQIEIMGKQLNDFPKNFVKKTLIFPGKILWG